MSSVPMGHFVRRLAAENEPSDGPADGYMATNFSYSGTELEVLAKARNYYRWILRYFRPHLSGRVAEVGAGLGSFSEYLVSVGAVQSLYAVEPADNLIASLNARFHNDPKVIPVHAYFESQDQATGLDAVVVVNVIEHIEDDRAFLSAAFDRLKEGGRVLLFVPALPWLYGTLDRAFDHYRRYTQRSLRERLEFAGFHVATIRYMNMLGIVSWYLAGRVVKKRSVRPIDLMIYDRIFVPWISRIEQLIEPPIGQSLLVIAHKKLATENPPGR